MNRFVKILFNGIRSWPINGEGEEEFKKFVMTLKETAPKHGIEFV